VQAIIKLKDIKPISKQHGTGRNGSHYYPKPEYVAFKDTLAWEAVAQLREQGWRCKEFGVVWLSVLFKFHHNIGDISNLIGGIEDALEGVAYKNDCQVFLKKCCGAITKDPQVSTTIYLEANEKENFYFNEWINDGLRRRKKRNGE
jgi:Holliday junction resolvase RusA-like endonuclease